MKKHYAHDRVYQGSAYHLMVFTDPQRQQNPCLVVSDLSQDFALSTTGMRIELATSLTKSLGTTPDRIDWYEIGREGTIREYRFVAHQHTVRPYANDLSAAEIRDGERRGLLRPVQSTSYTCSVDIIPREQLEAKVGEPLPVPQSNAEFAAWQNREFGDWSYSTDWRDVQPQRDGEPDLEP